MAPLRGPRELAQDILYEHCMDTAFDIWAMQSGALQGRYFGSNRSVFQNMYKVYISTLPSHSAQSYSHR